MLLKVLSYNPKTKMGMATFASQSNEDVFPQFMILSKKYLESGMTYSFRNVFKWLDGILIRHEVDYKNAGIKTRY